jgi:hypothetical protein
MGTAQDAAERKAAVTAAMSAADTALAALQYGWGDAYQIEYTPAGWQFRRRDGIGDWETAPDPDELWRMMREDYDLRPLPRRLTVVADESKVLGSDPGALLAGD